MNLGARIAIIVLSIVLVAGGSFFGTAVYVLSQDFDELEHRDAESKLALLQGALEQDELEMRATIGEFVQIAGLLIASNQTETGNLTSHLLQANQVDAFAFGFNGTVIGQEFNWTSLQLENSTRPVFSVLANSTLSNLTFGEVKFGMIRGESRYLVASEAMFFGNQSAVLIVLREMGDQYLAGLEIETGLLPVWVESGTGGVRHVEGRLQGTIELWSPEGESIGALQVQMSREITENANKTWVILGIGLVGIVLVFGFTISLLVRRFVLNRIKKARVSMEQIADLQSWDEPMDLGGDDEIALMATQFNVLMAELDDAQKEIIGKNESLERYARSLSHDLRSPLSTLNLNLHLLAMRDKGEEIPRMQRTVARIDEQIRMILEDARKRASGFSDANDALEGVLEDLEAERSEHGATITSSPLPMVPLSDAKLRSLLQNLIGNAMKFHRGNGATIQVAGGVYGGGTYITVKDDGVGMNPEKMGKVKEEFVGDGYGIGLATCNEIMASVGRLDMESEEGVGTQFTMWFEEAQSSS